MKPGLMVSGYILGLQHTCLVSRSIGYYVGLLIKLVLFGRRLLTHHHAARHHKRRCGPSAVILSPGTAQLLE